MRYTALWTNCAILSIGISVTAPVLQQLPNPPKPLKSLKQLLPETLENPLLLLQRLRHPLLEYVFAPRRVLVGAGPMAVISLTKQSFTPRTTPVTPCPDKPPLVV